MTLRSVSRAAPRNASASVWDKGSQCAQAMPLFWGIGADVYANLTEGALAALVADVAARNYTYSVGTLGSRFLLQALSVSGRGDVALASRLLGHDWFVTGEVIHGQKLGRTLGFPTANIALDGYLRPRYGIYAVTGTLPVGPDGQARRVAGAANVGIRPSFDPPKELLEPHFFDFAEDLYGQEIEVAFHHFLRPEAKFDSLDDLTAQMKLDCDEARRLLGGLVEG